MLYSINELNVVKPGVGISLGLGIGASIGCSGFFLVRIAFEYIHLSISVVVVLSKCLAYS